MYDTNSSLLTPEDRLHQYFLLFQQGSPSGLAYLEETLSKSLYHFAGKKTQNKFETDTIIQDAFLWMWEHRQEIENLQQFKTFLYNQVRWRCLKYLKKQTITTSLDLYEDKGISLTVYNPEKEAEERERARIDEENWQLLEKALPYLHPDKKVIMELLKRGFSHKQIGKRLGRTSQAVKKEAGEIIKEMKAITKKLKTIAIFYHQKRTILIPNYQAYLSPVLSTILKLHDENRYSLSQIANELKMTQFMVLKKYQEAKWKLESLNKTRKRKYPH